VTSEFIFFDSCSEASENLQVYLLRSASVMRGSAFPRTAGQFLDQSCKSMNDMPSQGRTQALSVRETEGLCDIVVLSWEYCGANNVCDESY
jgi:hypothetical protein